MESEVAPLTLPAVVSTMASISRSFLVSLAGQIYSLSNYLHPIFWGERCQSFCEPQVPGKRDRSPARDVRASAWTGKRDRAKRMFARSLFPVHALARSSRLANSVHNHRGIHIHTDNRSHSRKSKAQRFHWQQLVTSGISSSGSSPGKARQDTSRQLSNVSRDEEKQARSRWR